MKVKSESDVAQSCPTLCDPMDCSPPGSSVRGIFQAIAFSSRVLALGFKFFFSSFIKWAKDEIIVSGRLEGPLLGAPGTQELFIFTPVGSNSSNSVC